MSKTARDVLIPTDATVFRIAFLYVGQGEATLLLLPDAGNFRVMLVDTNVDKENGGIDMVALLKDLLDEELDVFVNTHPHTDHVRGIKDIHDAVGVKEVWHSGHVPSKEHRDAYDELQDVINDIGTDNVYELRGTREENTVEHGEKPCPHPVGEPLYNVLSPAQYVKDEIAGEKPADRDRRIHEQCGVIRFVYGKSAKGVLLTGDSDRTAWEERITDYHAERLSSHVLSASHHGSRTFFKDTEDDAEPYKAHMDEIKPSIVIISAPKQSESKFEHPHDDAIDIYKDYVGKEGILHLGAYRVCIIVDIDINGNVSVIKDTKLVQAYGFDGDDGPEAKASIWVKKNVDEPSKPVDKRGGGRFA